MCVGTRVNENVGIEKCPENETNENQELRIGAKRNNDYKRAVRTRKTRANDVISGGSGKRATAAERLLLTRWTGSGNDHPIE